MSDTPAVPSLEYESGRDRRQRIPRTAGFQLFLAITIALGMTAGGIAAYRPAMRQVQPRYERWTVIRQRDAAFRELLNYSPSVGIVFDERAPKRAPAVHDVSAPTTPKFVQRCVRAGAVEDASSHWIGGSFIDGWSPGLPDALFAHDRASNRLRPPGAGLSFIHRSTSSSGVELKNIWIEPVQAPLFIHGRRAATGQPPRVVIVGFDGPRFVWGDRRPVWVRVIKEPGDLRAFAQLDHFNFETDPSLPVRLYAGEPDPADASHFTISYEAGGVPGTIDGWLRADDTVTLQVRDGPAKSDD